MRSMAGPAEDMQGGRSVQWLSESARSKRVGCGDFLRESSDKKIIENVGFSLEKGRKYYDFDWVLRFRTWKF